MELKKASLCPEVVRFQSHKRKASGGEGRERSLEGASNEILSHELEKGAGFLFRMERNGRRRRSEEKETEGEN